MDVLLRFLVEHYSFLYTDYGFRFVDSDPSPRPLGNAYVDMRSGDLKIRLVRDRGQIWLTFYLGEEKTLCGV